MTEQRKDYVTREVLQRLVDEAAGKAAKEGGRQGAIEVLNAVTIHDMNSKEGQEAFRADGTWAHSNRIRCDRVQEKAVSIATTGALIAGGGVLWASWDKIRALFQVMR